MYFESKNTVLGSDTDTNANLSILAALQKLQDNICFFFGSIGLDQITLKEKYHAAWIFSKNKLKIFKNIGWNQTLNIKSFISSVSAVKIIVDTIFTDQNDDAILYSRVEMCLVDLDSQRIKRIADVGITSELVQPSIIDFEPTRLSPIDDLRLMTQRTVYTTNLDMSMHTNNVEYVRFLLDTIDLDTLKNKEVSDIEINYLKETTYLDNLAIFSKNIDDEYYFEIKKEDSVLRAKISFRA